MITAVELKKYAYSAGAMGCGIAGIDRFADAPEGFRPTDIYSKCKSVIVVFRQMPTGAILAENPIPYTHAAYKMYEELDRLSMQLLRYCQSQNVNGVIIPSDTPYLHWDDEKKHGRGILSLKHAAVQAGLGIMGRSTIFINHEYGNMVYLGAILIDAALEADPLEEAFFCPPKCNVCRQRCPQQAIGEKSVDQKLCRAHSFFKAGRGWDLYNCNVCRRLCPLWLGGTRQVMDFSF